MDTIEQYNPIHRFSVAQFHQMIEAGVFAEGDRVELIDGELCDMAPIGPPHGGTTNSLTLIFVPPLAGRAIVSVQGPLNLNDGTEVYPDLLILQPRDDRYARVNPTADDVLLAIEVADSSLALDTGPKLARYARAGLRRYWVADVRQRVLHDYRDPDRVGRRYRQLHSLDAGALVIALAGVEVRVAISDLFPG